MHIHQLLGLLHHALLWSQAHGALPPRGVQLQGFIFAIWGILSAIFSAVAAVVSFVADAASLVFASIADVAKFAARGVVWLAGTIRDGFGALVDSVKSLFGTITDSINSLWSKVSDFFNKVRAWLQPITDFLHKLRDLYDQYWQTYVKPVLDTISRVRKALGIFKYFGLQWAQKLDSWLADVQNQIIKNTLWLRGKLNEVISWVNAVSDPYGFMRLSPILGGFVNGLDQFWQALTGQRFFGTLGTVGGLKNTAHISGAWQQQAAEIQSKSGDAGEVFNRAGAMRQSLYSEMGFK